MNEPKCLRCGSVEKDEFGSCDECHAFSIHDLTIFGDLELFKERLQRANVLVYNEDV